MSLNLTTLGLGLALIGGAYVIIDRFASASPELRQSELISKSLGTKVVGESCGRDSECSSTGIVGGPGSGIGSQIGCCAGVCRRKRLGGLGIYWCPSDQPLPQPQIEVEELRKTNPSLIREYETKGINESCERHTDCSNTGTAGGPQVGIGAKIGCCNNKCAFFRKDYVGTYWCSDVCKNNLFSGPGTCNQIPEENEYNRAKNNQRRVVLGSY